MKRGFVSLVFLFSLLNAFAVVQDQSQSDFGTWADLRPGGQKVELAQTFQPGIAGQLTSIGHSGVSPGGDPEYPTTFSIVDTVAGVPGTNVLGSTVITNISAQTTVYFTNQQIFLETNAVYAIVISTEAPLTSSEEYSFRSSFGDSYSRGSLWSRPPGGSWSLAFVEISPTTPMDLVFATFMEPGIPDIRIVQPEQYAKVTLGQSVPVVSALPSYLTNAASVDFYASNTLLGTASTPPYSINWTPVNPGTNLLYAVLSKTDGSSVTSAVQQVVVTDVRPVNDDFAQRLLLGGEVQTAPIDQSNATTEIGEPRPFSASAGKTVWWQWTPPRTARATVVVTPAPQDNALLSLFTGSQLPSLYLLTNHSDLITQLVQGGTNYQISLDSSSNSLSGASLSIALNDIEITQPAPQTQLYAPATFTLTGSRTATTRTLTNVMALANQVPLGTYPLGTGTMICSLPDSGYYNLELAATDTNGITTYSVDVPMVVHPGNDNFAQAQTVSGRSIAIHASNLAATMQLTGGPAPFFPVYGEPTWGQNQGGHSIWYRWTAPADGLCVIDGAGTNFALLIDVCLGSDVNSLSVVTGNALSTLYAPVEFDAIAGTTYYISLDGFFGEEGQLDWTLQLKPYNDDFADRRLLVGLNNQFQDSNSGSTLESGEALLLPSGAGSSLWYTWQAPVSGQAVVDVSGTNGLALGVFEGDDLSDLVLVATNAGGWTNSPTVTFSAQQGVNYQIGVFGQGNSSGLFNFQVALQSLRLTSPLPNSILPFPATLQLAAQLNVPGTTLTNIVFKVNNAAVGTATNAPFTLNWAVPAVGTYTLSASGTTSDNVHYDSPPLTCLVYGDKRMPRPRVYAGVGSDTSYVINAVGALYVFGGNSGQFGWPSTNEPSSPFLGLWPANVTGWQEISSGWAISDSGQLYQNGTTLIPLPAGVTGWKAVSCGFDNIVTVSEDGELYLGGTTHLDIPRPAGGWRDARASLTSVNNFILALGEDNQAYTIGFQYGESQYSSGLLAPPAGVAGWKRIAQAALFSVLLTTNDELYIYGEYGGVTGTSGAYGWTHVPKPAGVNRWVDFAAGGFHVLAIGDDAQLYCWGRDWEHQLGLGGTGQDPVGTPTLVPLPAGVTGWSAVAGGQFHSLAIGNDCSVYAWGDNDSGQDGQPASAPLTRPFQVGTLEALCGTPVIFTDGNASRLPDGSFRLQFNTDLNRAYLVQYSDDFKTWKTANSTIIGTGDLVEWIDNGPPQTDTPPTSSAGRIYRVIYAH